jgi:hypothetical protein
MAVQELVQEQVQLKAASALADFAYPVVAVLEYLLEEPYLYLLLVLEPYLELVAERLLVLLQE